MYISVLNDYVSFVVVTELLLDSLYHFADDLFRVVLCEQHLHVYNNMYTRNMCVFLLSLTRLSHTLYRSIMGYLQL